MSSSSRYFKGLCEPEFDLVRCKNDTVLSTFHIDPCNCTAYYQCLQTPELSRTRCSAGTAFDPVKNCILKDDVYFQDNTHCDTAPWLRCKTLNVTPERIEELKALCTNTTYVLQGTTTVQATVEGPKTNAGMVIGLIVAGIAIAVIAILLVLFIRRWRQRKQKDETKSKRPTTAMNIEYFENGRAEDPYATIPDSIPDTMGDPSYNSDPFGNPSSLRSNGTLASNITAGRSGIPPPLQESVEYDNSAFKENSSDPGTDSTGYTSTLTRSLRDYERPTNIHEHTNEDVTQTGPTNMHWPNSEYVAQTGPTKISRPTNEYVAQNGDLDTSDTTGDAPDYFVFEK